VLTKILVLQQHTAELSGTIQFVHVLMAM